MSRAGVVYDVPMSTLSARHVREVTAADGAVQRFCSLL
ncbi:hypothetical protein HIR79_06250 [Halomonas sp. PGE1]|nr:hypothetical protein HIR79_06250 [Halomonas sp. PGE1]